MERTNKMPLWQKTTPGTIILRTPRYLRIKENQKVRANPEEIQRFIDQFELLEGNVDLKKFPQIGPGENEKPKAKKEEYTIEHLEGGWYNVLSPGGEVMNDKKLRSDKAQELKQSLEEKQPAE